MISELIRFALALVGLAVFAAALFHLLITASRRADQRRRHRWAEERQEERP